MIALVWFLVWQLPHIVRPKYIDECRLRYLSNTPKKWWDIRKTIGVPWAIASVLVFLPVCCMGWGDPYFFFGFLFLAGFSGMMIFLGIAVLRLLFPETHESSENPEEMGERRRIFRLVLGMLLLIESLWMIWTVFRGERYYSPSYMLGCVLAWQISSIMCVIISWPFFFKKRISRGD